MVKNLPCIKKIIAQVNDTIMMLDLFEEVRPFSNEEWNLREILKSHMLTLIQN
jgi:hypothetical protein